MCSALPNIYAKYLVTFSCLIIGFSTELSTRRDGTERRVRDMVGFKLSRNIICKLRDRKQDGGELVLKLFYIVNCKGSNQLKSVWLTDLSNVILKGGIVVDIPCRHFKCPKFYTNWFQVEKNYAEKSVIFSKFKSQKAAVISK